MLLISKLFKKNGCVVHECCEMCYRKNIDKIFGQIIIFHWSVFLLLNFELHDTLGALVSRNSNHVYLGFQQFQLDLGKNSQNCIMFRQLYFLSILNLCELSSFILRETSLIWIIMERLKHKCMLLMHVL